MKYEIPYPVLLDASAQNEVKRLIVSSATITESLSPLSTATITLPAEETIPIRSYVKMYTVNGLAGIYRTRAPEEAYVEDTSTIDLEHALCEIGDHIIDGELNVNDPANVVAATIMSAYGGTLWALGTCEATQNIKATLDNSNALNALSDLMAALPDYMMTFDFSSMPWLVNIVAKPTAVSAEGRLSRNIASVHIEQDDTELCTRVYMDKLANGHLDADTIGTYGVVERYITGDDAVTAAEAQEIAQKYLDLRKNPTITITISAQDLFQVTGDTLDKIQLGTIYRLVIPENNVQYEKIVTTIEWSDIYGRPGEATITLADEASNLSSVMAGLQLQISKVTNTTHLLSNAIKGDRERLEIMSREISIQGEKIDINADNIDLIASEEERAIIAGHDMTFYREAGIAIASNGVSIRALETETNNISGRVDRTESELSVQSEAIRAKVSKGDVSTQLSVELGNVTISGGNLVVSGYVTASEVETEIAAIRELNLWDLVTNTATVATTLTTGGLRVNETASLGSVRVNGSDLESNCVSSIGPANTDSSSGGVSIPWTKLDGSSGSINFNVASTAYFQQAVAAAYERGVQAGAGTISVDALTIVKSGSPSWSNSTLYQDVTAYALHNSGGADADILKQRTVTLTIDASAPYNAGVESVVVSSITNTRNTVSPSGKVLTAIMQATASNGATRSQTFNINIEEAYNTGWNAALDACVQYNVWVADRAGYEYDDVGNEYYVLQASHRENFWKLAARK